MADWYLGLSTSGHDPALALVDADGQVRFAESTERFLQDKRAWGITPDHVPHLEKALAEIGFDAKCDQLHVSTSWASAKAELGHAPHDLLLPATDTLWMQGMQAQLQRAAGRSLLRLGLSSTDIEPLRVDHHYCHAVASAWFAPVDDAVCLVLDGEGEVGAASVFHMSQRSLKRSWRSWGPGSLGTFYGWLTKLCGFDWRLGEEWKVMGLAAFGTVLPDLLEKLEGMVIVDRGRLRFADPEYLRETTRLCEIHARAPGDPIEAAANLAATGQAAYGIFADKVIAAIIDDENTNLVLSGGCALNSSYNGTIGSRLGVTGLYVPPCPADDGNAIGAALAGWMQANKTDKIPKGDGSPFLGSTPRLPRNVQSLARGLRVSDVSDRSAEVIADCLSKGQILGVMKGRAEFGPRALGNRSILADPRPQGMKDKINALVKGRESYRPFAPVLREADVDRWFVDARPSPYMSLTLQWRSERRAEVPATVHADGTGRLQTVGPNHALWLDHVVGAFEVRTGVPVLLNTSFNIMGKPIVHSAEDALAMLMTSGLDAVLIDGVLFEKPSDQADSA